MNVWRNRPDKKISGRESKINMAGREKQCREISVVNRRKRRCVKDEMDKNHSCVEDTTRLLWHWSVHEGFQNSDLNLAEMVFLLLLSLVLVSITTSTLPTTSEFLVVTESSVNTQVIDSSTGCCRLAFFFFSFWGRELMLLFQLLYCRMFLFTFIWVTIRCRQKHTPNSTKSH